MNEDIKINKNIKINSDALLKNLELSEEKLKNGMHINSALNEADWLWYTASEAMREHIIDKLDPKPTPEYTEKLIYLVDKYRKDDE